VASMGLTYIACQVIVNNVDSRFLSYMELHDVVSVICQALPEGSARGECETRVDFVRAKLAPPAGRVARAG